MSLEAGGQTAGSVEAGAHSGGSKPNRGGAGGAGAGADNVLAAGEAGELSSGGSNGGAGEIAGGAGAPAGGAGAPAGGAGAPAGGADTGGGGALAIGGGGAAGTAGSSGAAGGPSCVSVCTAQETCCYTTCANLTTNALNCGVCGNACNVGRNCAGSACKGGWVSMSPPPVLLVARSRAAVTAMGKSVFFWGGQDGNGAALDTGAIYDPHQNTWKYLPKDLNGPSARMMASAVWTGGAVIVFGGTDANGNAFRDGASYDPTANQWTALPANAAVTRRSAPSSFWDGTRAIFWGGLATSGLAVSNADRFDTMNWSVSTPMGDPGALLYPGVAFDGATMYLFGGLLNNNRQDKIYSYTPSTDAWGKLANSGLTPRSNPFTVWDGTRLVVWGGRDDMGLRSDGSYLLGNKWTALAAFGAPSARMIAFRRSGWGFQISPGVIAMIGGQVSLSASATLTTAGALYNVGTSTWTAIPTWISGEAHEYGMGAWTGEEFVLWGGRDNNSVTLTGDRWAP